MKRLQLFLIFVVYLLPAIYSHAQTVESVLRAVQERVMVKYWATHGSGPVPYQWGTLPNGQPIPPFPADGTITDLKTTVEALNIASGAFDYLKSFYVAFDEKKNKAINVRNTIPAPPPDGSGNPKNYDNNFLYEHEDYIAGERGYDIKFGDWYEDALEPRIVTNQRTRMHLSPVNLPSVGEFNESNWMVKLKQLASNVNQLRSMVWPYWGSLAEAQRHIWPGTQHVIPPELDENLFEFTKGYQLDFPGFYHPTNHIEQTCLVRKLFFLIRRTPWLLGSHPRIRA